MTAIIVRFASGQEVRVQLREGTDSVRALAAALPFKSVVHRWGSEIYFDAPFHSDREGDARTDMEVGEVAFWPDGDAVALFFGPTPISTDKRPRAYSPCNILGRVDGPTSAMEAVREGTAVEVRLA